MLLQFGSIPKSGYIAYSMGKVAGYAVANQLLGKNRPLLQ